MARPMRATIVDLNPGNLNREDIVCVRGEKNQEGIACKKSWLRDRFSEGFRFKVLKINGRSWGFIEYGPAENAWRPVDAPGYVFIHCLWVIGRYKNQGLGKKMLAQCLEEAKGKNGLVVISSPKPFLAKKDFFLKNGFEVCDKAAPYFELLVRRFKKTAPLPKFREKAKKCLGPERAGLTFYYTDQCPYIAQSLKEMTDLARKRRIPSQIVKIRNKRDAQGCPSAYGTFAIFLDGQFLTHQPFYGKELDKLLSSPQKG
jgi:ribosomal protein S18 acetylase RimI-like enzyme